MLIMARQHPAGCCLAMINIDNLSFDHLHLNGILPLKNLLKFQMKFLCVVHSIIAWCQTHQPVTICYEDLEMVTSRALLDAAVDVLHFHDIVGDGLFVRSTAMECNPYLMLLAVHLFVGGLKWLCAITKDTCLVT